MESTCAGGPLFIRRIVLGNISPRRSLSRSRVLFLIFSRRASLIIAISSGGYGLCARASSRSYDTRIDSRSWSIGASGCWLLIDRPQMSECEPTPLLYISVYFWKPQPVSLNVLRQVCFEGTFTSKVISPGLPQLLLFLAQFSYPASVPDHSGNMYGLGFQPRKGAVENGRTHERTRHDRAISHFMNPVLCDDCFQTNQPPSDRKRDEPTLRGRSTSTVHAPVSH